MRSSLNREILEMGISEKIMTEEGIPCWEMGQRKGSKNFLYLEKQPRSTAHADLWHDSVYQYHKIIENQGWKELPEVI